MCIDSHNISIVQGVVNPCNHLPELEQLLKTLRDQLMFRLSTLVTKGHKLYRRRSYLDPDTLAFR
jgi:hypothetical protein